MIDDNKRPQGNPPTALYFAYMHYLGPETNKIFDHGWLYFIFGSKLPSATTAIANESFTTPSERRLFTSLSIFQCAFKIGFALFDKCPGSLFAINTGHANGKGIGFDLATGININVQPAVDGLFGGP